jgi:hypothetical protein
LNVAAQGRISEKELRVILREILDLIVLHVRDYRGSRKEKPKEVFANLLVEDGNNLVVVMRDSMSHSAEYERPIPRTYPKASLACGRAIMAKKPFSVGRLIDEYPEGPKNKPYRSILAIPLFPKVAGKIDKDCDRIVSKGIKGGKRWLRQRRVKSPLR